MNPEDIFNLGLEANETKMTNYKQFKNTVRRHGFSINNFYDVIFDINASSPLYGAIVSRFGTDFASSGDVAKNTTQLMRLYTDECSIPGVQMSTGEYRVNNSPQLKYVYGSVFTEASFSFIMDADSIIKKVFDLWTSFMYGYAANRQEVANNPIPVSQRMRTRYRDDYAIDIIIIKYEKPPSSKKNHTKFTPIRKRDIIPDFPSNLTNTVDDYSGFGEAIPVYSNRMFKAFPSSISSVPLNSGASSLSKLSVTFEFESYTTSALTGTNSVFSNVIDVVNG